MVSRTPIAVTTIRIGRSSTVFSIMAPTKPPREAIDPIVDKLNALQVPFVFATGYGEAGVSKGAGAPVIEKPYTRDVLANALIRIARPRG